MMIFTPHSTVINFIHKRDLVLMKVANHSLNPDHILAQLCRCKDDKKLKYPFPIYKDA
jgi:hypothetical protein